MRLIKVEAYKVSPIYAVSRNTSVSIATRYELDGPGIESRWRRNPSRPALASTHPPVKRVPGFFLGGKASGASR